MSKSNYPLSSKGLVLLLNLPAGSSLFVFKVVAKLSKALIIEDSKPQSSFLSFLHLADIRF